MVWLPIGLVRQVEALVQIANGAPLLAPGLTRHSACTARTVLHLKSDAIAISKAAPDYDAHQSSFHEAFEWELRRIVEELSIPVAESPNRVLQRLPETALALCKAGSAGVSVWDTENPGVFRWRAVAGKYSRYLGETLPRDFSPCGEVLNRNSTLLMSEPHKIYPYISDLCSPVRRWRL